MRTFKLLSIFIAFFICASGSSNAQSQNVCNCKGYAGVGGPCYAGVGGAAYSGVGGPAYTGVGGACYAGVGGPKYDGVGGPAYKGVGGPAYDGVGGQLTGVLEVRPTMALVVLVTLE